MSRMDRGEKTTTTWDPENNPRETLLEKSSVPTPYAEHSAGERLEARADTQLRSERLVGLAKKQFQ